MPVGWDTVAVGGSSMRVYAGVPDQPRCAGVLVAHHGPGLDSFVKDAVHRLFREGYVAAAPDLYHRQPPDVADAHTRAAMLRDEEVLADMNATMAHVRALDEPAVGVVGIVGFCLGGRTSFSMATLSHDLAACAVFYGGNILERRGALAPPFERIKDIHCPVIGFFGDEDTNPSPADVGKIDVALTQHGKPHEFHQYEGAGHAFMNFMSPRYRAGPARAAWGEMLAFFREHLRA